MSPQRPPSTNGTVTLGEFGLEGNVTVGANPLADVLSLPPIDGPKTM
jgi:hypothetical protein